MVWTLFLSLFSMMVWGASESPQSFSFQGRLLNASGTAPLEEPVIIQFKILDPSGTCLLYQESQSIDLTNQEGVFSLSVGAPLAAPKRTLGVDPALSMASVFKNNPLVETRAVGANCPAGYTPTAGDVRLLRVTVTPQSTGTPETLTPDQIINSVPHAIVAETLQGLYSTDFIQKDPVYVTDANVKKIFGSLVDGVVDASSLHHHDGRYVQVGGSSSQDLGSGGFHTSGKGSVGSSVNFTNTTLSVKSDSDTSVGLAVRAGSPTQGADLFQVQNNAGAKLMGVDAEGGVTSTKSTIASNAGNQFQVKYDNTNYVTLDVSSTGQSTFTAAGTTPQFSFMNGWVGVGVNAPAMPLASNKFEVAGSVNINWQQASNTSTGLNVMKRGATGDASAAIVAGEIGYHGFYGWNGSAYGRGAYAITRSIEPWSPTAQGAAYLIATTNKGSVTSAERFRIDHNGNVGIGSSLTPLASLHVSKVAPVGTIASTGTAVVGTGTNFLTSFNIGDQIVSGNQTKTITAITDHFNLTVSTAFSPDLVAGTSYGRVGTIMNSGNVGIGTTAPTAPLEISKVVNATGTAPTTLKISGLLATDAWTPGASVANIDAYNNDSSTPPADGVRSRISTIVEAALGSSFGLSFSTSSSTLTEKMRITSGGNVGIGTTTPTSLLHVNGEVKVGASTLTPNGSDLTLTAGRHLSLQAGASGSVLIPSNLSTAGNHIEWLLANRNLTFNGGGQFSVDTSSNVILQPTSGSKVGIGTSTPAELLTISSPVSPTLQIDPGTDVNANPTIYLKDTGVSGGYKIWYSNTGGSAFFDSKGNIDTYATVFRVKTDGTAIIPLQFNALRTTIGAGALTVQQGGNVGIGIASPTEKLQVAGVIAPSVDDTYDLGTASLRFKNIFASNGTVQTSDLRMKRNIQESDLGLDFINKLRPVSYYWKEGSDKKLHYGLIAQETEEALSQIKEANHRQNEVKNVIVTHDSKTDRYGVRYTELLSPVIKAIQELYAKFSQNQKETIIQTREIASLKEENEKLKRENAEIKARLDKIEKALVRD